MWEHSKCVHVEPKALARFTFQSVKLTCHTDSAIPFRNCSGKRAAAPFESFCMLSIIFKFVK